MNLKTILSFLTIVGDKKAAYVVSEGKLYDNKKVVHLDLENEVPFEIIFKGCFSNSLNLLLSFPEKYKYVQGYYNAVGSEGVPLEHGWCIDTNGNIVDITADRFDITVLEYFGVEYSYDDIVKWVMDPKFDNCTLPLDWTIRKLIDRERHG